MIFRESILDKKTLPGVSANGYVVKILPRIFKVWGISYGTLDHGESNKPYERFPKPREVSQKIKSNISLRAMMSEN